MSERIIKGGDLKKFFVVLGAVLFAVVLAFPIMIGVDESGELSLHIGMSVLGADLDYECDGIDDDVQFQGALDELSVSGGMLFVHGGDYAFASNTSVTRSIDNVSIVGVGCATYITGDGSTPLFIAGGDNWLFMNIRFDAGNVTVNGTEDWLWFNVYVGSEHYALIGDDVEVGGSGSMEIHGNEYHSPDFATASALSILDGRVGVNEADILEIVGNLTALDVRVTVNEGDIGTLENDVVVLDGRLDTAESDIISLESLTSSHSSCITALQVLSHVQGTDTTLGTMADDIDLNGYDLLNAGEIAGYASSTLSAVTLYVDGASGNDGNDGSQESPKATIEGAVSSLPKFIAHDVVIKVRDTASYELGTLYFNRFNTLEYITLQAVNSDDEVKYDYGTASGGTSSTLVDSSKSWSNDQFNGAYVWVNDGSGEGECHEITDTSSGNTLTISGSWSTNPDGTTCYAIGGGVEWTSTGAYNIFVVGEYVNVYGFDMSGASYANAWYEVEAMGTIKNCRNDEAVSGYLCRTHSELKAYWNYFAVEVLGLQVSYMSSGEFRANVIKEASSPDVNSKGIYADRNSINYGYNSATYRNSFWDVSIGYYLRYGTGLMNASVDNFDASVGTQIDSGGSSQGCWYT